MVCPFHFCGEASAAGPPGTPGMASVEMDHLDSKSRDWIERGKNTTISRAGRASKLFLVGKIHPLTTP